MSLPPPKCHRNHHCRSSHMIAVTCNVLDTFVFVVSLPPPLALVGTFEGCAHIFVRPLLHSHHVHAPTQSHRPHTFATTTTTSKLAYATITSMTTITNSKARNTSNSLQAEVFLQCLPHPCFTRKKRDVSPAVASCRAVLPVSGEDFTFLCFSWKRNVAPVFSFFCKPSPPVFWIVAR